MAALNCDLVIFERPLIRSRLASRYSCSFVISVGMRAPLSVVADIELPANRRLLTTPPIPKPVNRLPAVVRSLSGVGRLNDHFLALAADVGAPLE
jgi:hypothetical protein